MATTPTIKLAGPDRDGNYKVLQVKNTLLVKPGQVYTEECVKKLVALHRRAGSNRIDTTVVEHRGADLSQFGVSGGNGSFSEESGGVVFDRLHL